MPVFRNVRPSRQSGRLGKQVPVIYDKDGWPITDGVDVTSEITSPSISSHSPSLESHRTVGPGHTHRYSPYARRSASPLVGQEHSPPGVVPSDVPFCSTPPSASSLPALPARKSTHTRRKDPAHIPRPRNAFIFFRSWYITEGASGNEGQQNELSKHAGKVWNRMSEEGKRPFVELAIKEKREHTERYPDYVYAPGGCRGSAKAKARAANARRPAASAPRRKTAVAPPKTWEKEDTPEEEETLEVAYSPLPRSPRVRRAAAQRAERRIAMSPSPSPESTPTPSVAPTPKQMVKSASAPPGLPEQDDFVPTDEIPVLVLNPPEEEFKVFREVPIKSAAKLKPDAQEPQFDMTIRPFHYDCPGVQFAGFKPYANPAKLHSYLPAISSITSNPGSTSPLVNGVPHALPPVPLIPTSPSPVSPNVRCSSPASSAPPNFLLRLRSATAQLLSQPPTTHQFYELANNPNQGSDCGDVQMDFESSSSSDGEEEWAYSTDAPIFTPREYAVPAAREIWEAEQAQLREMEEMYVDFDAVAVVT
ncbi:unnamed protein product [Cyclocybe aegerita]|uniref:HMG box domain-containing protein n=1 Tax=Cyclocybe aegerita TaxID=1973307 RepID=A0A8S0W8Y9_CYCAE|nr:unnamed protein product [Cyclocybe aegerita]